MSSDLDGLMGLGPTMSQGLGPTMGQGLGPTMGQQNTWNQVGGTTQQQMAPVMMTGQYNQLNNGIIPNNRNYICKIIVLNLCIKLFTPPHFEE